MDDNSRLGGVVGATSLANATPIFSEPRLVVVVDTEEEFDWSRPFSRAAIGVGHIKQQDRAQRILERYGIKPTYAVDFPIATQAAAYGPLREWLESGKCDIGAHLHPWVNPPYDEEVSNLNSFPGNLPSGLEREKLARLTDAIATNFGRQPKSYRAGRYGIGRATGAILEELGFRIDTSVVARTDFRHMGGPDFSAMKTDLFWFGPSQRILEVPLTVGWCGLLGRRGGSLQKVLTTHMANQFRLPGVCARLGLYERIRLTPEGASFAEMKRLTDSELEAGNRIFLLSYHSPSVAPGNTPYVRDGTELEKFLGLIDRYCEYFVATCGGIGSTLEEVHELSEGSRGDQDPNRAPAVLGAKLARQRH